MQRPASPNKMTTLWYIAVTDLCHLLAVGLGVERCLGEQDWVLLGGHTQLVVERVMPDLLHVVPVGDDAVLDGVLQRQDASLALCLVADVAVLLTHPDHHALQTFTNRIHCLFLIITNQLSTTVEKPYEATVS